MQGARHVSAAPAAAPASEFNPRGVDSPISQALSQTPWRGVHSGPDPAPRKGAAGYYHCCL